MEAVSPGWRSGNATGLRVLHESSGPAAWSLWPSRNTAYTLLLGAMFLVTLATTVVYYGTFRFTFCLIASPVSKSTIAGCRSKRNS